MTYGVFAIVANEASPSGCSSYTYDLYGSTPYLRGPWFQFSEQLIDDYAANGGTHPAYPFLTGVGGANRVAVFGYLGLRLMVDSLNVDPSLPPQIPNLNYRTIYWQGWPVDAVSNQTHTVLSRSGDMQALDSANATFADAAIPVTIGIDDSQPRRQLEPKGSVVLENRRIGEVKTVSGNIAQCRPVQSGQEIVPGQFALAAVDGATSTKWQVSCPKPPRNPRAEESHSLTPAPPAARPIQHHLLPHRHPPATLRPHHPPRLQLGPSAPGHLQRHLLQLLLQLLHLPPSRSGRQLLQRRHQRPLRRRGRRPHRRPAGQHDERDARRARVERPLRHAEHQWESGVAGDGGRGERDGGERGGVCGRGGGGVWGVMVRVGGGVCEVE